MVSHQELITLQEEVRTLKAQLGAILQRGVVHSTVEEDKRNPEFSIQSYADSPDTGLERIQDYGFGSRPLPGSEAALIWLNGKRDVALVISVADRRYRMVLEEGDVALYDHRGQKVHLHKDGVTANVVGDLNATVSGEAFVDCSKTFFTGDVYVGGNFTLAGVGRGAVGPMEIENGITNTGGDIVSDGISLEHHKTEGVEPGSGLSGEPV